MKSVENYVLRVKRKDNQELPASFKKSIINLLRPYTPDSDWMNFNDVGGAYPEYVLVFNGDDHAAYYYILMVLDSFTYFHPMLSIQIDHCDMDYLHTRINFSNGQHEEIPGSIAFAHPENVFY